MKRRITDVIMTKKKARQTQFRGNVFDYSERCDWKRLAVVLRGRVEVGCSERDRLRRRRVAGAGRIQ